jgi:glycerophosphoryl diester phosphodiesterase
MHIIRHPRNISLLCVLLLSLQFLSCTSPERQVEPPLFIAHAGGGLDGQSYTNSLEALNTNYEKGFRFFEMDFSWTADDALVAIHDWGKYERKLFVVPDDMKVPTKAQFLQLKSKTGLTQLSLQDVVKWAEEKRDVFIITDVKNENIKALQKISTDFEKFKKYFIPQVYNYQEYDQAVELGYNNVILTLYRMRIVPFEVASFAKDKDPFAITMATEVVQTGLAYHLHTKYNTRVYAHTVNDIKEFNSLREIGVFGVYTDYLGPH